MLKVIPINRTPPSNNRKPKPKATKEDFKRLLNRPPDDIA